MFSCALRLYPAASGLRVRCGCVCLGLGFRCAPPLLARVLGCLCFCMRAPLVPRHSWLGCAVWLCVGLARVPAAPRHSWLGCWGVYVFVYALRLYPATPGCVVRCGCVCLGLGFGCAPPLLAGVLGCLCVCVRAPLVPRNSWLGCAVWVRVFGLGFRLRPATPGSGIRVCVCLCARSACTPLLLGGVCGVAVCVWTFASATPRHSLAGLLGCVCVHALLVPRHSRLGCALWVLVFGLGFWLRPATPGWGVGVRVCLSVHSACTPPLLAGVCGVGGCAWAIASAASCHSWLGCWGVCLCAQSACTPPLLAGLCGVCVCVFWLGFGCGPPFLAGVFGCVCVCVRAPFVPCDFWLGCALWVCLFGLGSGLRPATPGWGVGVCVCLGARSACTPPLLAGLCGVGGCACTFSSAAPHHSWLR